ncbi:MAG: CDP-alcohol phosphatidyltransferase family protein, partial [Stackebrandtia sp.]
LYGFRKLGVPAGVVIAAGGLSLMHEYVRGRGHIAGLRDIGIATLGERSLRAWTALAGYGLAGAVALTATTMSVGLATGIMTIAATAWLLLALLGFVQLMIVVSAALRK